MKKLGMALLGFVYRLCDLSIEIFFLFDYTPLMKKKKNTAFQQVREECKFRVGAYMLIFFIIRACLFGQADSIRFKHLSVVDGLSQEAVYCIIQDRKGFMWFGTQDGLNRYDGYNFKVYKNIPNENSSISDKYILCLYEDREGVLWIGTRDGGLNRYNRESDNFINYKNDQTASPFLGAHDVRAICEGPDGILWVGTQGGGLLRLDKKTNIIKGFKIEDGLSDNNINVIFKATDDRIWIGTRKGLDYFDQTKGKFFPYIIKVSDNKTSTHNVTAICEESKGNIWIGTLGGKLYKLLDRGGNPLYEYNNIVKKNDPVGYNPVRCIFKDKDGMLWVGTQR